MGTGHKNLASFLPDRLKTITEVSVSDNWTQNTIGDQILRILIESQEIEESLWIEGFNQQL